MLIKLSDKMLGDKKIVSHHALDFALGIGLNR